MSRRQDIEQMRPTATGLDPDPTVYLVNFQHAVQAGEVDDHTAFPVGYRATGVGMPAAPRHDGIAEPGSRRHDMAQGLDAARPGDRSRNRIATADVLRIVGATLAIDDQIVRGDGLPQALPQH